MFKRDLIIAPMRPIATVVVLLVVIPAQPQDGHCPDSPGVPVENYSEHWFDGSMGARQARMYLASGGGVVSGTFYFTDAWDPVLLGGTLTNGRVDILAHREDAGRSTQMGHLTGTLKGSELSGTWVAQGGNKKVRVRLKAIPKPHCETNNGQWRLFNDPQWPITFQYPASWHMENDGNSLTLTCPDPETMAYEGFNISVSHGVHRSDEDFWLKRCGKGWYSSECDCNELTGVFCDTPAEVMQKDEMTFISADEQEWRGYCIGGGYMGQTEGARRVILIGDQYVQFVGEGAPSELIEEIIPTVKRH